MSLFYFKTEQFLPINIEKAWDFFSSPKNLALITPPELDFKILTKLDDKAIYEGMIIQYTVKPILGIPLPWKTEICKVNRPSFFTDKQLKGPYKLWEHTHTYHKHENGVKMQDEIKYELPLGILGNLAHKLFVKKKIERIFSYRRSVLEKLFGPKV
ncbi:MAG: SRPBCC family protein [Flavobacterium sp.]|nr:SRPBCC family protein [Pedobacter sp.]